MNNKSQQPSIFENKSIKKKCWLSLWSLCALFIALEFLVHRKSHFGENGIDGYMGFFAILGFMSCFLFFVIVKLLAAVLKRQEDYYDN